MKICKNCDEVYSDNVNYCSKCGTLLEDYIGSEVSENKDDEEQQMNSVTSEPTEEPETTEEVPPVSVDDRRRPSVLSVPWYGIVAAAAVMVLLLCGAYMLGYSTDYSEEQINENTPQVQASTANERFAPKLEKIEENADILSAREIEKDELESSKSRKQTTAASLEEYAENKAVYDQEILDLQTTASDLEARVQENSDLSATLDSQLQAERDKPVTLTPGIYLVGRHIDPGYYVVTGDSNLFVYSSTGRTKVNTILGGSYGVESYTCTLSDGDVIQAEGEDTFTLAE